MIRLVNCIALFSIFIFANCVLALPTPKKTTLSWIAPTTNVDGSSLTDLGGYKIYWSTVSGIYNDTDSKDVQNVSVSYVPVSVSGVYYFAVTAYDVYGNESDFSNEVKVNIFKGITPPKLQ